VGPLCAESRGRVSLGIVIRNEFFLDRCLPILDINIIRREICGQLVLFRRPIIVEKWTMDKRSDAGEGYLPPRYDFQ